MDDPILSAKKCGDLFSRENMKQEYKNLIKQYHPDINDDPKATEIFAHINLLYNQGLALLAKDEWAISHWLLLKDQKGEAFRFHFLGERDFELGKFYLGKEQVIYLLDETHGKYYEQAIRQIKSLWYRDMAMESEFKRLMPQVERAFSTNKRKYVLVIKKPEDYFLLSDVLAYFQGKIPPEHVAWIISRLSNICCYFNYLGIAHNGISLNNCFISPKNHTLALLGGWWYACLENQPMLGTQKTIYNLMPVKYKSEKIATIITDLECVKYIGKTLLDQDESSGWQLQEKRVAPEAILDFLLKGSSNSAWKEFNAWNQALDLAYGPRKFVPMDIAPEMIYGIKEGRGDKSR